MAREFKTYNLRVACKKILFSAILLDFIQPLEWLEKTTVTKAFHISLKFQSKTVSDKLGHDIWLKLAQTFKSI